MYASEKKGIDARQGCLRAFARGVEWTVREISMKTREREDIQCDTVRRDGEVRKNVFFEKEIWIG
jgi:hypothetical protein